MSGNHIKLRLDEIGSTGEYISIIKGFSKFLLAQPESMIQLGEGFSRVYFSFCIYRTTIYIIC